MRRMIYANRAPANFGGVYLGGSAGGRSYERLVGRLRISGRVKFENVEPRLVGELGKTFMRARPVVSIKIFKGS